MNIDFYNDCDAEAKLRDELFGQQWDELYGRCPWASVFQSRDFVLSWYDAYKSRYRPIIVTGRLPGGALAGLFVLAIHVESGRLSVAGDGQAEYQAWLAAPQEGNAFIEAALDMLGARFPSQRLTLLFVAPGAPVDWAVVGGRWKSRCHVRSLPRGLMRIGDGSNLRKTLQKKRRSKLNRLKRLGELHLDRIEGPEELAAIFDEVTCYQALRLRAVHHLSAAPGNPLQKAFYLNLARRTGLLHATALRVDDKLVSAQIHIRNRDQVLLGLIAHSPFYGRYSPGELHILMTGLELAREAVPVFDLTPGGQYKERFATHHDEVHVAVIFFRRTDALRHRLTLRLAETAKSAMELFRVSPARVRETSSRLLDQKNKWIRMRPGDLLVDAGRRLKRAPWRTEELVLYSRDLDPARECVPDATMARDRVADLLAYAPCEPWQPAVHSFLNRALERLADGHHVYTQVREGRVVQYAWLMRPQPGIPLALNGHELLLPPGAVLLADFYTERNGAVLPPATLSQMLYDAARVCGATKAYLCLPSENAAQRAMIDAAGFRYEFSSFRG